MYASAMNPSVRSSLSREFSSSHSANALLRRHRGEKKAIPEEQKDGKYFERRKRNNEAAKRSRDARKLREDRVRGLMISQNDLELIRICFYIFLDRLPCVDPRTRKRNFKIANFLIAR